MEVDLADCIVFEAVEVVVNQLKVASLFFLNSAFLRNVLNNVQLALFLKTLNLKATLKCIYVYVQSQIKEIVLNI